MKCDSCGIETVINYGNSSAVLCGDCSASDEGKKMMAENSKSARSGSVAVQRASSSGVIINDIQMPFSSMVVFMVKWTLASIPALIILLIILTIVLAIFGEMILG